MPVPGALLMQAGMMLSLMMMTIVLMTVMTVMMMMIIMMAVVAITRTRLWESADSTVVAGLLIKTSDPYKKHRVRVCTSDAITCISQASASRSLCMACKSTG